MKSAIGRLAAALTAGVLLSLPGVTQQILVIAHYPDGKSRDVTREAVVASNNPEITGVTNGVITAIRRGEGPIAG